MKVLLFLSWQLITIAFAKSELCDTKDTSLNNCLLERLENARPYLMKGMPEIRLRALDPLQIPYFEIHNKVGDLVQIDAIVKDVNILGINNIVFQDVKYDADKSEFVLKVYFPAVYSSFNYDFKGKMFDIPIQNQGYFVGNATDVPLEATVSLGIKENHKDGKKYFKIKEMKVSNRFGEGQIAMDSKDKTFQSAADVIVEFFNRNSRMVLDAFDPIFEEAAAEFLTKFFNPTLAKLPLNEIFVDVD